MDKFAMEAPGDEDGILTVDGTGLLNDMRGSTTFIHFPGLTRILLAGYRSLIRLMADCGCGAVELWAADVVHQISSHPAGAAKPMDARTRLGGVPT